MTERGGFKKKLRQRGKKSERKARTGLLKGGRLKKKKNRGAV